VAVHDADVVRPLFQLAEVSLRRRIVLGRQLKVSVDSVPAPCSLGLSATS
jgi:hypothetical protein